MFLFFFSLLQADQSELKIKTRFVTVDLMVDSENAKVAAWQCELRYDKEKISIVGIEGNDLDKTPPRYDSQGLKSGRIKLAHFQVDESKLGKGKFRLARLHLMVKGDLVPGMKLISKLTADPAGNTFSGRIFIVEKKERTDHE